MAGINGTKSTLDIYHISKINIEEEKLIDNMEKSKLLVRGRTNTLTLYWRNRHQGKSEQCPESDCKSLRHFYWNILIITLLKQIFFLQQIQNKNSAGKIQNTLAFENLTIVEIENRNKYVKALWKLRYKKQQQKNANQKLNIVKNPKQQENQNKV